MRFKQIPEYLTLPFVFSLLLFLLLFLTANNYGIFMDELYYVACANHLSFGYVDQPPFIAWITRFSLLFGNSLYILRILPALAGSGTILLSALIAHALGGNRFASALASLTILSGTIFWVMFGIVSMNAYDIFFITLASYIFILILQNGSTRQWILLGVIIGLGVNTKLSMAVFGFGLFTGLLLMPERSLFLTRKPWITAAVALTIYLPHIIWQFINGWPTIEFIREASSKNLDLSVISLIVQLAIASNPLLVMLWFTGIVMLFRLKLPVSMRPLAIAVLVFVFVYLMNHSKFYYLLPMLPLLLASGSVTFEKFTQKKIYVRTIAVTLIVILGIMMIPFGVPILPIESFVSYTRALGLTSRLQTEHDDSKVIPGYFSKRIGWAQLTQTVASVYNTLPDSDRAQCGILGFHYGESAAVDYFGPALGLPESIGRHESYWLWGPRDYTGKVMIVIVSGKAKVEPWFQNVKLSATYEFPYIDDDNRVQRIYICRDAVKPLPQLWSLLKEYR